jgi:hypothetical protein
MFISQPKGPALNQFDFVVEPFGHAIGVTMPDIARNRFKPSTPGTGDTLKGFLSALTGSLNQFQQGFSGWFVIFALKPLPQVLYPVNHLA